MVGVEYWQDQLFLGVNFYQPIGNTKRIVKRERSLANENLQQLSRSVVPSYDIQNAVSITDYESSQSGFDAEIGYSFSDNLTGYVGGYYFHKNGTETTSGPKARFTYEYTKKHGRMLGLLDGIELELGVQHDKPRGTLGYVGIKFKIGLTDLNKNSNIFGFERHMTELVRRDPDIVIGRGKEKSSHTFYQTGDNGFNGYSEGTEESLEELLKEFGLSSDATLSDVKKQYRKYALKYHPDRHKNREGTEGYTGLFIKYNNLYGKIKKKFVRAK